MASFHNPENWGIIVTWLNSIHTELGLELGHLILTSVLCWAQHDVFLCLVGSQKDVYLNSNYVTILLYAY
jgi:hypothetical protein